MVWIVYLICITREHFHSIAKMLHQFVFSIVIANVNHLMWSNFQCDIHFDLCALCHYIVLHVVDACGLCVCYSRYACWKRVTQCHCKRIEAATAQAHFYMELNELFSRLLG